ncbi:hypothetical protein E1B28_006730 [Marasmius oreades]|uniref:Cytochrome P450 n=1 Tax=Marasmius oreades TaxID=181124 RepID=A0A9P7UWQ4_9AGAR|nr:uncharacterized protein E1B28_006730 [Marasmius oreades]KAG7096049.1 hypothetical protein E1B28_006730 [Marasmius oreades]
MNTLSLFVLLVSIFLVTKLYDRGCQAQRGLPSNGFSSVFSSYINGILDCVDGRDAIRRACSKYGNELFTFCQLGNWVVLVHTPHHLRDLCNASEDILSMEGAAAELLQLGNTVGPEFGETYHIPVIRTSMNLHMAQLLPSILNEMECCFKRYVDTRLVGGEWTPFKALDTLSRMMCQTSNRAFVGLPLCRNEEYIDVTSRFASQVLFAGSIMKMLVPRMLRKPIGLIYRSIYRHHRRILKLAKPIIEERKKERHFSKEHPTEDMIGWLLDAASDSDEFEPSAESLAMRLLNVNFVALHTTTKIFVHALYHLAANPQYILELRQEAEQLLDKDHPDRWSKEALGRCVKLDSFFKETLRVNVISALTLPRLAVKDFRFSDGTQVSAGHYVACASEAVQRDSKVYPSPDEFRPFRFVVPTSEEEHSLQGWPNRMTSTSETFPAFGGGRHLCPGRFFAAMVMKMFMAYLVLNYDVKMPRDGVRPADEWLGPLCSPATRAHVLFRKRQVL